MKKLMHILTGWGRKFGWISTSEPLKKLSELRMQICGPCDYSKPSSVLEIINGQVNQYSSLQCTKCSCPCEQKSLVVDEKCPLKKW